MITMQDAISDLLEAGIISKDEARKVLMSVSEEADEESGVDEGYASAALGGGKTGEPSGEAPAPTPQSSKFSIPGSNTGEGYSF